MTVIAVLLKDLHQRVQVGGAPAPSIHVVMNWFAEFRDRQQD